MSRIEVGELTFEADVAGPPHAPVVILLHGFPQTRHTWRHELPALADAGYRAVAPDQRGYSAGARPPGVAAYRTESLVGDVLGLADAVGAERFHLVGHDWGGQVAWLTAALHPGRVESLTVLSRPHPAAFARSFSTDGEQSGRSRHHKAFQDPGMADRLLADDARRLRRSLAEQGVGAADADAYLSVLSDPAVLDAALNWYRAAASAGTAGASGLAAVDVPDIVVPTLYLWGSADASVGRTAAELTAEHVSGPYRFVEVPGAGHFLTDEHPESVTLPLVRHVRGRW